MLRLAVDTDPAWGAFAAGRLDEVLLDHAHCEKKAAGAAVTLLFRYPERATLQEPLAALAREELGHFEAVLGELARIREQPVEPVELEETRNYLVGVFPYTVQTIAGSRTTGVLEVGPSSAFLISSAIDPMTASSC